MCNTISDNVKISDDISDHVKMCNAIVDNV